jgi:hypothetical protein
MNPYKFLMMLSWGFVAWYSFSLLQVWAHNTSFEAKHGLVGQAYVKHWLTISAFVSAVYLLTYYFCS